MEVEPGHSHSLLICNILLAGVWCHILKHLSWRSVRSLASSLRVQLGTSGGIFTTIEAIVDQVCHTLAVHKPRILGL